MITYLIHLLHACNADEEPVIVWLIWLLFLIKKVRDMLVKKGPIRKKIAYQLGAIIQNHRLKKKTSYSVLAIAKEYTRVAMSAIGKILVRD
jgi:hypothetical protein